MIRGIVRVKKLGKLAVNPPDVILAEICAIIITEVYQQYPF